MSRLISISLLLFLLLATSISAHEQTLYLLRHFEKQSAGNDPALTSVGQQRAKQLAIDLADVGVQEIYSSDYTRTRETVTPLAKRLGLSIKFYDPAKPDEIAAILTQTNTTAVVAGHSNTTPTLVRLLGGQAEDMDESQYGIVFKLEKNADRVVTTVSHVNLADESN